MKQKIMITGVAGLIGSHLAEKLLESGYEIHAMDIMDLSSSQNLCDVRGHKGFHYYQGDIRSSDDLDDFFQTDASVIYHLASVVGVNRYMEDPLSLIDIGVLGTRALIGLCHQHGVRMLYTSTSEVYGRNPDIPWAETDDRVLGATDVDRWSYSTSKAMCEHMLFGVHHKDNWPMSIVRFFNVYGPRQNPIYVVSKSVYRVLNGQPPELYDGGLQTRCFTFIDDVIDGIILSATKDSAIGQVIKALEDNGLTSNTVLVFASDHGDFMGDHGIMLKGPLHYRGLIRVPFIWFDPASDTSPVITSLAQSIDIPATFLERSGIRPYFGMQGTGLMPTIYDGESDGRDALLIEDDRELIYLGFDRAQRVRTVVTADARMTLYEPAPWGELYDLAADPLEVNNLWNDPAHQSLQTDMTRRLLELIIRFQDWAPLPTGRA